MGVIQTKHLFHLANRPLLRKLTKQHVNRPRRVLGTITYRSHRSRNCSKVMRINFRCSGCQMPKSVYRPSSRSKRSFNLKLIRSAWCLQWKTLSSHSRSWWVICFVMTTQRFIWSHSTFLSSLLVIWRRTCRVLTCTWWWALSFK